LSENQDLLERWLYDVDALIDNKICAVPDATPLYWQKGDSCSLTLGDYAGQGRYLHYSGIGHFLFNYLKEVSEDRTKTVPSNIRGSISKISRGWWLSWIGSEVIVSIAIFSAFTIAFNTPTVGLGCRSFSYAIQWGLSSVSWVLQGKYQEPPEIIRCISLTFSTLSTLLLIMLMAFQVSLLSSNSLTTHHG
jgi:hypothetical protein